MVPPKALGPSLRLWCWGNWWGDEGTEVLDIAEKAQQGNLKTTKVAKKEPFRPLWLSWLGFGGVILQSPSIVGPGSSLGKASLYPERDCVVVCTRSGLGQAETETGQPRRGD